MRIIYSLRAKEDLSLLLQYYQDIRQLKAGRKIRARLILTAAKLRDFPQLGKKDEDFSVKYKFFCRSLVCDNHKIIYRYEEDEQVTILRFFDNRQGV